MPETILTIRTKSLPPLQHAAEISTIKDLRKFLKSADKFVDRCSRMFPQVMNDKNVAISVSKK